MLSYKVKKSNKKIGTKIQTYFLKKLEERYMMFFTDNNEKTICSYYGWWSG